LTTAGVAALNTAQAVALLTNQVVALTTNQVAALSTLAVQSLTTNQIQAIETADLVALKTSQIAALATASLQALTTNQAQALTTSQVRTLNTAQLAALGTTNIQYLNLSTPIVLDLNGDGIKTVDITKGVKFDIFATGQQVNTGWVSPTDGLLVLDRNHDGAVNDGSELFGSSTTLSNGSKALDGYAALRDLDANQDGVMDSNDAVFNDLKVWVDANSDGASETGELKSLSQLGITSISTQAVAIPQIDNGNLIGLTSSYQTADGETHEAADVWFLADRAAAQVSNTVSVDTAIAALNQPSSVATQAENVTQTLPKVAVVDSPPDLRARVSGLTEAINSFVNSEGGNASSKLHKPDGKEQLPAGTTLAVSSMTETMKQFDSGSKAQGSSNALAATLNKSPGLGGVNDPAASGPLASPLGKSSA
jgi:hypothetical protein